MADGTEGNKKKLLTTLKETQSVILGVIAIIGAMVGFFKWIGSTLVTNDQLIEFKNEIESKQLSEIDSKIDSIERKLMNIVTTQINESYIQNEIENIKCFACIKSSKDILSSQLESLNNDIIWYNQMRWFADKLKTAHDINEINKSGDDYLKSIYEQIETLERQIETLKNKNGELDKLLQGKTNFLNPDGECKE